MTYTTGNPERDRILRRAIGEVLAVREQPTLETVADHLPNDQGPFALGADELAGMLADMRPQEPAKSHKPVAPIGSATGKVNDDVLARVKPVPPAKVVPVGTTPAKVVSTDTTQAEPEAPEAKITREQSQHLMDLAHVRLDNARIAVKVKQQELSDSKRTLADAIMAWQEQADPLTPAQRREREMRQHLASEQAKRAARGGVHPNAAAYVQKRMTNSGNHRGAFPRQFQGRNIRTV